MLKMLYKDYLQLEKILSAQKPLSNNSHDEMLFIVVHQVYELWFKQILVELDSIMEILIPDYVPEKALSICIDRSRRIIEIQHLLVQQFRVLETMSPLNFLDFRSYLGHMSGFQSEQFRELERKMGPSSSFGPTFFSCIESWLERTPFLDWEGCHFVDLYRAGLGQMEVLEKEIIENNPHMTEDEKASSLERLRTSLEHFQALISEKTYQSLRDKGKYRFSQRAMQAAVLITLYNDRPLLNLPNQLLGLVMEIDNRFTAWRFRHGQMTRKMIGNKTGTGGSSGYDYLMETVSKNQVFTDLYILPTLLLPREALPELPQELEKALGFSHS